MRINKWLSAMGICSRREADRYISEGKLWVNGEKASLGMEILGKEEILLEGKLISGKGHKKEKPKPVLLKYYKPRGIICTTGEKDRGKNVIEAIGYKEKEYIVSVDKPVTKEFLQEMSSGVYLPELERSTRRAVLWQDPKLPKEIQRKQFHIVLTEGLNRQIRRMCEALGYEVTRLKRIRVMNIELGKMRPGEYFEIKREELELF